MAVYCFTRAIQAGKREEARAIFEEITRDRRDEYEASRRRLGIREERVWFQSLPEGDMAVVYWEATIPERRCRSSPLLMIPTTSGSGSG